MSFAVLPVELIDFICECCSVDEIKDLRLTCQTTRNVANDHLFPEIATMMTTESMSAAREIAEHPKFRKSPTGLWLQADRLQPMEYNEWKTQVDESIEERAWREMQKPSMRPTLQYQVQRLLDDERRVGLVDLER